MVRYTPLLFLIFSKSVGVAGCNSCQQMTPATPTDLEKIPECQMKNLIQALEL